MSNYNPNNLEGGHSKSMTIEELVDLVDAELTFDCALPQVLPPRTIRRLIETQARPWFYQYYFYSVQKNYFFLDRKLFETDHFTRYKWIYLPEDIQTVIKIYKVDNRSLFQLGINSPNLSVNLGTSNNSYLQSYMTTIGELGIYKTVIDSFADMLNQLSLSTVKYDYNQMANRLNLLTSVNTNLIIESYVNIEAEHLYSDPLFIRYVNGLAKTKLSELVGRYEFNLVGDVKYNPAALKEEGKADIDYVEEYIKKIPNSNFVVVNRR